MKLGLRLAVFFTAALTQLVFAGNPVVRGADPHAAFFNGTFYVYPTSGHRDRFYAYSSTDLVKWERHPAILDFREIDWIPKGKNAWAPAIIEKDSRWFFYFSAGPKPSRIGVATGTSPIGPFTDSSKALLSDNGKSGFEAIDPMAFKDPKTGKHYLYAGGSSGAKLRVFELADDMVNFTKEIEVETPEKFTEGAFMHERNGIYYMSYSHGNWKDETYSVHYATSETPIGPWQYQGAILTTNEHYRGPGHHSFVHVPATDQWLIFYHRWENAGPLPQTSHDRDRNRPLRTRWKNQTDYHDEKRRHSDSLIACSSAPHRIGRDHVRLSILFRKSIRQRFLDRFEPAGIEPVSFTC